MHILRARFCRPKCAERKVPKYIGAVANEYESLLDLWDGLKIMGAAPETRTAVWVLGEELKKQAALWAR